MRMILTGIVAAALISAVVGVTLYGMRPPVYEAMPMSGVRVGDPGHNLVGRNWNGINRGDRAG